VRTSRVALCTRREATDRRATEIFCRLALRLPSCRLPPPPPSEERSRGRNSIERNANEGRSTPVREICEGVKPDEERERHCFSLFADRTDTIESEPHMIPTARYDSGRKQNRYERSYRWILRDIHNPRAMIQAMIHESLSRINRDDEFEITSHRYTKRHVEASRRRRRENDVPPKEELGIIGEPGSRRNSRSIWIDFSVPARGGPRESSLPRYNFRRRPARCIAIRKRFPKISLL